MQQLHPKRTTWHITWGTYGTRMHGDARPTVDKTHNRFGEIFVSENAAREASERGRMKFPPVSLTIDQRRFIEQIIVEVCHRGGWELRTCAAAPDHIHVLVDIDPAIHGEKVRRLLKRWIGQELSKQWQLTESGSSWWAEEGSNRAIHDARYLNNAFNYVQRQRTLESGARHKAWESHGAEDGPAHGGDYA